MLWSDLKGECSIPDEGGFGCAILQNVTDEDDGSGIDLYNKHITY